MRKWLVPGLICLSFATAFYDHEYIAKPLEAGTLLLFLACIPDAKPVYATIATLFVAAGVWLHVNLGSDEPVWTGFAEMFPIVVLLYVSFFMAIPLRIGPYVGALGRVFFSFASKPGAAYPATLGLAYLLSAVMNLAAVPMVAAAFGDVLARLDETWRKRILAQTLTRGFSLALLWTPVTALNVSTAHEAGANWNQLIPFAIGLSVVLFVLNAVWGYVSLGRSMPDWESDPASSIGGRASRNPNDTTAIVEFFAAVALFLALLLLGNAILDVSILALVSILIPLYALAWSFRLRNLGRCLEQFREHFRGTVPGFIDQPTLFLAVGFFIAALGDTGSIARTYSVTESVAEVLGAGVVLLIVLLPVFLSQMGLFPVLGAILVAQLISPESVGLRPEWLALAAMGGAISGTASTGLSVISNTTALVARMSATEVARHNVAYTVVSVVFTVFLVIMLQHIFPS